MASGVTIIEPGGYPTEVWVNRNRYSGDLKARTADEHKDGYPEVVARMGTEDGSGRSADPMDVPRALAGVLATARNKRPLRLPVSGGCSTSNRNQPGQRGNANRDARTVSQHGPDRESGAWRLMPRECRDAS